VPLPFEDDVIPAKQFKDQISNREWKAYTQVMICPSKLKSMPAETGKEASKSPLDGQTPLATLTSATFVSFWPEADSVKTKVRRRLMKTTSQQELSMEPRNVIVSPGAQIIYKIGQDR
jgi:hypothetical protein